MVSGMEKGIRDRVDAGLRSRLQTSRSCTPPLPRSMLVELSNGCNHACIFCTNPHMQRKVGRIGQDLLFRVMAEAHAGGVEEVGFYTTGEPFVHKDLPSFTAEAARIGFSYIFITTNGALAAPERAKAVIDAGMSSIKFSINAGSRETYRTIHGRDDWDTVLANLRFISGYRRTLERPLALAVSFVVTDLTAGEKESFSSLVAPLVDDIIFLECTSQMGQSTQAQAMLAPSVAKLPEGVCHLPFDRLHLTCEGYLTLCCTDYHNYLAVADLNNQSLADAWNSQEFQEIRRRHIERDLCGTMCGRCWLGDEGDFRPLVPALASPVNSESFERSVAAQITERLGRTI